MNYDSFAFYNAVLRKNFVSYCSEKLSKYGVTYIQLFVLIYIDKKKDCSSKDIVEYLKIDAGQLNRVLMKLIEKDFIILRKSDKDKRFNVLRLTESGANVVEESRKLFDLWDAEVLADLDENGRKQLMSLMNQLVTKLNEKNGGNKNGQINRFHEQLDRKI